MTTRICTRCGLEKDIEEFPLRNRFTSRRQSYCMTCRSEMGKEWYENNKDYQKANARKHSTEYREAIRAKTMAGHQVQVDVKFLQLKDQAGKTVKRYQYTDIDDATRIRALQIYPEHNQARAIQFIDYVVKKFPFRISTVRMDRGHEFQARFHWHVEDQGMRHVYIKPQTPQLNGKVERSHRTDQTEFYQLLTYTDDIDLNAKLKAWENFYNYDRPHLFLAGKTPYEVMKSLLQ